MPNGGMTRRRALGLGAAAFGSVALSRRPGRPGRGPRLDRRGHARRAFLLHALRRHREADPGHAGHGARERRRLRRRLLPAPGRQHLRARGRRGQPRLHEREPGRRRARRQGRPDRLRLHRGADARGPEARRAHRRRDRHRPEPAGAAAASTPRASCPSRYAGRDALGGRAAREEAAAAAHA